MWRPDCLLYSQNRFESEAYVTLRTSAGSWKRSLSIARQYVVVMGHTFMFQMGFLPISLKPAKREQQIQLRVRRFCEFRVGCRMES